MRRSEALKQLLPYLEITNGVASIGDRPYGMPRKVFAPMARKLVRLCERDGYIATAKSLGGAVVSIVDKAGESFEIGVLAELPKIRTVMPLLDDELGVFPKESFSTVVAGTFELTKRVPCETHPAEDVLATAYAKDGNPTDGFSGYCPHCGATGPARKTEHGAKQALLKGLKK